MQNNSLFSETSLNPDKIIYYKSFLKSAVQKCIRRNLVEDALPIAKSAIEKDIRDFCRRLMIIVLEDAVLHPLYTDLAVLTKKVSTSKGLYEVTNEELNLLLKIVYDIAKTPWRDFDEENENEIYGVGTSKLSQEQLKLVEAIKYRSLIGGLKWDIIFLKRYEVIWTNRFDDGYEIENLKKFYPDDFKPKWEDVDYATPDNIPLVSVDIHCFPPIKRLLLQKPIIRDYLFNKLKPAYSILDTKTEEGLIAQVMWHSYISDNYKKVFWYNPPSELDRIKTQLKGTEEQKNLIKGFAKIAMPEIESIARWYISKQKAQ